MAWLMPSKPAAEAEASRDEALRNRSHLYSQYLNVRSLAFSSDSHCASTFCQACNDCGVEFACLQGKQHSKAHPGGN